MIEKEIKKTETVKKMGLSPRDLVYRIVNDDEERLQKESGIGISDATNFMSCLEYLRKKGKIVF